VARYFLRLGDREVEAELEETPSGLRVLLDGVWHNVSLQRLGDGPSYVLVMEDRLVEVLVAEAPQAFNLQIAGRSYEVETVRRRAGARREEADLAQGDVLMVVEAMKMLNELRSRVPGAVGAVNAEPGQRVEIGTVLVEISEQA
jgi:acetyl/propionyl-CoA carboxylase alpha subunit